MTKLTESAIETFAIERLEKLGYQYLYAPNIAPDSETPERERFEEVLLLERLRSAVARINPSIAADVREEAIKQVQRLNSPQLITNNETFHRLLTEGIKVTYQHNGKLKSKDSREELSMAASGTSGSHQRVRPEDILNIGISLPSIALAEQYSELVESGINKLMVNLAQIQSLEKLRDTILPKLMSGEVRVDYQH